MKKQILYILIILGFSVIRSQSKYEIFPDELNIHPFSANFLEPKLGFLIMTNVNELRLDIGNSTDILHYRYNENTLFSFGADLFTFTLLRSEKDFHFPVDAVDYLFGFNAGYKFTAEKYEYGIRFRLSHISAHFVDGHFNGTEFRWRDNRSPRVYSREFVEFFPFYNKDDIRLYVGFTYVFHVDPINLGKDIYNFGIEYYYPLLPNISFTAAYDLRIVHLVKYSGNNTIDFGLKFGKENERGIKFYIQYYNGKSIHGEYFDFNKNYSAIGINLDL